MRTLPLICSALLSLLACSTAFGQAVISTHSGLVNFSEGTVLLDDQPLQQKAGSFPTLKDASTLRTEDGRAEVLLTPGVFLRVDEQSSVRMISSLLSDTRVELLSGSAFLDAEDAAKIDTVVLLYKGYEVRMAERGVFRLNSSPGVLQAYTGVAKIAASGHPPVTIDDSHQFFFDIGLETEKIGQGTADDFSEWASNRSDAISAENASVADNSADPGDQNSDPSIVAGGGYSLGLPTYSSPVAPVVPYYGLGSSYLGSSYYGYGAANPFFNRPLGYPGISVFAIPRPIRRPRPTGYPTWLNSGQRLYPVPVRPIRPIYPMPVRTGLRPTGIGPIGPITSHPVMPVHPAPVHPAPVRIAPGHPSFAHPIGHR